MNKHQLSLLALAIVLVVGMTGLAGCADGLTGQPYSNITQENSNLGKGDFSKVIGPVYSNMRGLLGGRSNYFTQEITTDEMVQPANASGWDDGGVYRRMHKHNWTALQTHVGVLWSTLYQGVMHANRIIAGLNDGTIKVPERVGQQAAISEVKAARVFYYWLIMDNFGAAPLVTKPASSTELPSKTSRADIYQFVVDELKTAISNLSEANNTQMYGRFNKWTAKTVLAAVYLNAEVYTGTANWEGAITQTNDVINSGKYRLESDYKAPFKTNNQGSEEIVFSIPFDAVSAGGFDIHLRSFHASLKRKFQMNATPYGAGSAKAVPQFGGIYDEADKRKEKTWLTGMQFTPNGDTLRGQYDDNGEPLVLSRKMENGIYTSEDAGWRIGKFEIAEGATGSLSNDFPIFRYARVLMMKAEALLRTGRAAQAASIVSQVRQRAFDDPSKANVTASTLQQDSEYDYGYWENFEIVDEGDQSTIQYGWFLDELGREFAAEMFRRRDMIRFGVFTEKSWLSHRPNGDYRTVFPIPQGVVQSNPNLEQNSDY